MPQEAERDSDTCVEESDSVLGVVVGDDEEKIDSAVVAEDLDPAFGVVVEVPPDDHVPGAKIEHEQADTADVVDFYVSEGQLHADVGDGDAVPPRPEHLDILEVEARETAEDAAVAIGRRHVLER